MKCPHCGYKAYLGKGKYQPSGRFYHSSGNSMQLERKSLDNFHIDIVSIVGCPCCKKTFINDD